DDVLEGGAGNDRLYGDVQRVIHSVHPTYGDDVLYGGAGDDDLWGDVADVGVAGTAASYGADTFVFGATDGLDVIHDFRSSDGDKIDLDATKLKWKDLDTNKNGILDNDDHYVLVNGDTMIDLGAAIGGDIAGGIDVVTVEYVTGLVQDDFIF
ncbi:MAG: hypothetical protein ACYTFF_20850, partial [Planctomycetota bacterium]